MTDHDPMGELRDSGDLPELHEARLGAQELSALQADLERCTEIQDVLPRTRLGAREPVRAMTLAQGFSGLRDGSLRGLQVRYRYQGGLWFDTLIVDDAGTRIVRMRQPEA